MEISQVIALRDFHRNNKAKSIKVTGDNMEIFIDTNEFLIWDDDGGYLYAIRTNADQYSQAEAPFVIITTTYDNIQYIEGIYDVVGANSAVDELTSNGTITDRKKEIIKKFITNINNHDVKIKIPNYDPFVEGDPLIPKKDEQTPTP